MAERTTKTGATVNKTSATARPTAGIAQVGQGMGGTGAGAPGAGGHGSGAGGDKVHKVLKALRTRNNGEAVAGLGDRTDIGEAVVESSPGGSMGPDDGTRT